jgi:hypothetical protein
MGGTSMTDLYIRPGVDPQPLPYEAFDADDKLWSDLANDEEGREATGWYRLAPAKPDDTDMQIVEWDADAEEWVMVNRWAEPVPFREEEPADPANLYLRPGQPPQPLPFEAYDEDGRIWTDLPRNIAGREATGWVDVAPPMPAYDPETQSVPRWDDGEWVVEDLPPPPEPSAPTAADIDVERDRRTVAGFTFGGNRFQSRPQDRENIMGAFALAAAALTVGGKQPGDLRWHGGEEDFVFIAEDDSRVPMDAVTVLGLGQAAAKQKSDLTFAANDMKKLEPIPADYADDAWWPG